MSETVDVLCISLADDSGLYTVHKFVSQSTLSMSIVTTISLECAQVSRRQFQGHCMPQKFRTSSVFRTDGGSSSLVLHVMHD